jgi:hypothetical protein
MKYFFLIFFLNCSFYLKDPYEKKFETPCKCKIKELRLHFINLEEEPNLVRSEEFMEFKRNMETIFIENQVSINKEKNKNVLNDFNLELISRKDSGFGNANWFTVLVFSLSLTTFPLKERKTYEILFTNIKTKKIYGYVISRKRYNSILFMPIFWIHYFTFSEKEFIEPAIKNFIYDLETEN